MVRPLVAAPILLLLATALSGCAVFEDGGGTTGTLVRIVDLRMDPEAFEDEPEDFADVLRALGTTRFEYTHDQGPVDPDDVTVAYTDDGGREREAPLSDFTQASSLGRGDRVTIDGALMTSTVRITHGGDTLAKRGTAPRDWLEAGGYPLPMSAEAGAQAVWSIAGGVQAEGHLDRVGGTSVSQDSDYVCSPMPEGQPPQCTWQEVEVTETMRVTDATLDAATDLDGELSMDVTGSDSDPIVRLGIDGTVSFSLEAAAHYLLQSTGHADPADDEHVDADMGFDVDVEVDGDGALTFRFRDGGLDRVGAEGDLRVSGDVLAWDEDHPRSEGYRPFDVDGTDESFAYEEEDVDMPSDPVDEVADALADLWRMDLAAGDEFRFATAAFEEGVPTVTYVVRVVEAERITVPAGSFDTWHVATTTNLALDLDGRRQSFDLPAVDTWLDQDSGVPVASQQTYAMSLDMADIQILLDMARDLAEEEGGSFEGPESFGFTLAGQPRMELTEWEDGIEMAPMASLLSPVWAVAGGFFFGFGMAGLGGFGGYDDEYEYAPNLAFNRETTEEGMLLTVVFAGSDVAWEELGVSGDLDCQPPSSGPVMAGEQIECFGVGTVRIAHLPTNTLIYETTREP